MKTKRTLFLPAILLLAILSITNTVAMPQSHSSDKPEYKRPTGGTVTCKFTITEDGEIKNIKLLQKAHSLLNKGSAPSHYGVLSTPGHQKPATSYHYNSSYLSYFYVLTHFYSKNKNYSNII